MSHDGLTREQVRAMVVQSAAHSDRRRVLYEESPLCQVCNEAILSVYEATVFTPLGGRDILLHNSTRCFTEVLNQSVRRFLGRPRRAS